MAQVDWGCWQRSLWPERSWGGSQSRTRPWLALTGPTRARPRTAWGLAALVTGPRAVQALSPTPSPLPRVKFLLMDASGSPQAETRWSDPITLHQGSVGEPGVLWLQSAPVDKSPSAQWSCSAGPSPCCHETGGLEEVSTSSPSPKKNLMLGARRHWVSLTGRDTSCVHPHQHNLGYPGPSPGVGRNSLPLQWGASPGPSTARWRRARAPRGWGQSQGRRFWETSLSGALKGW